MPAFAAPSLVGPGLRDRRATLSSSWGTCAQRRPRKLSRTSTVLAAIESGSQVVITGGTGFVGSALVERLVSENARVILLARDVRKAGQQFRSLDDVVVLPYDAATTGALDARVSEAIASASAIVNLAGEPIDKGRWTSQRKSELWDSRIVGTAKLARAAASSDFSGAFISASAVGYYGSSEVETFDESAQPGKDYLAKLATAWENAAWRQTTNADNVRTTVFRFGIVIGPGGGALEKMSGAFKAFLGGPPGSGQQVRQRVCAPCEIMLPNPLRIVPSIRAY